MFVAIHDTEVHDIHEYGYMYNQLKMIIVTYLCIYYMHIATVRM